MGDHHVCLGDIAQNITKKSIIADFPRGAWGKLYKSWLKSNKFQSF